MGLPKSLSPARAILLSLILLAAVSWIDYSTGQLSVTLLYFLPVGISSWFLTKKSASTISLLAALSWFWAFYRGAFHHGLGLSIWNSFISLAIFLVFSHLLSQLRSASDRLGRSADLLEAQVEERTSELAASNQELKMLNEVLQLRTEQLRSLSFELARAEERERRRIAHMLHDDLQQLLVAAKFSLNTLADRTSADGIVSSIETIRDLLDQSIAASRSLTAELVPPMLYDKGLTEALRWLAQWMQEKHGIQVIIKADDWEEQFAQDVLSVLFHSVRELLFNVVKHSRAVRASVTICRNGNDEIAIIVHDEGVGFDPAAERNQDRKTGFGLAAIRSRLTMMGGSLIIESAPGHGTTSTVKMPTRFEQKPAQMATLSEATKTKGERCRIIIADDHPSARQGLARLLRENPGTDVIGEAEDGQKAVELTRLLHPDVVVIDANLSGMNGIEAAHIIHREKPTVRIIGFSTSNDLSDAVAMHNAGVVAFLSKDAAMDDLLAVIRGTSQS